MTPKNFFLLFFTQWGILALLKAWFFNYQIFSNAGVQQIVFWIFTFVVIVALVRRFGFINFFEAAFLCVTWTVGNIILDGLITGNFTGFGIFSTIQYWIGYVVMVLSILIFHKMRHIGVRKGIHPYRVP
jgi:hypothetical protein